MLTVATYNILHGYYRDHVLANIQTLINKNVDVICLQETEPALALALNAFLSKNAPGWSAIYAHKGIGGNVALAWNTQKLTMTSHEMILLPSLPNTPWFERLKGDHEIFQRVALSADFSFGSNKVTITSIQLSWEGGPEKRLNQLLYLKNILSHTNKFGIIAGDFNTTLFGGKEQIIDIEKLLAPEYTNTGNDSGWTWDITCTVPHDGLRLIGKICTALGITLRSTLDYIFARNLSAVKTSVLDLPGSDHRPLIAEFELN